MELNLTRPLIFFDLETTGTNIIKDRIVEISFIKLFPDGSTVEEKNRRINPEIPIPSESTAVHQITDEDVKNCPTFREIAQPLFEVFEDSDIAGYCSNKFDIPMLMEEFGRVGINFSLKGRHLIDIQNIFYKKEPRTLAGAYRFYCGKEHTDAHQSSGDTKVTMEVLKAQLEKYPDLKNDVEYLANFSRVTKNIDLSGRLVENDKGEAVFNFGKYKGRPVKEVFRHDPSYYSWMLQGDFAKDTKDHITVLYNQFLLEKKSGFSRKY